MAKSQAAGTRSKGQDETEDTGSSKRSAAGKKTYRVRPDNTITTAIPDGDGGQTLKVFGPGETVELSDADAAKMPYALDVAERRSARDGQTSRLKKRIAELEAELERQKEQAKTAGKPDKNRPAAVESILARGDNHAGRGEPHFGSVPAADVEAWEAGRDRSGFVGDEGPEVTLDEETGMHGIGRASVSSPENAPVVGSGHGPTSQPATLEQNESQRPGATEGTSDPAKQPK